MNRLSSGPCPISEGKELPFIPTTAFPPGKVQFEAISYLSYSIPSFLTHHTMGHLYKMKENYLQTINVAKCKMERRIVRKQTCFPATRPFHSHRSSSQSLSFKTVSNQISTAAQHLERFDTSQIICMLKFWFSTNCSKISESASSQHFKYNFYL